MLKITRIQVRFVSKPYFSTKSPSRKKCVYALSVPFLVLLLVVSGPKLLTLVSSTETLGDKKAYPTSRTPWNIQAHGWYTRWVPRSLTVKQKTDRKAISSELLGFLKLKEKAFLSRTVTADETSVHHFESETRRSRTRNGTDRANTHLFLIGARL
jgi:hypothetical protein